MNPLIVALAVVGGVAIVVVLGHFFGKYVLQFVGRELGVTLAETLLEGKEEIAEAGLETYKAIKKSGV